MMDLVTTARVQRGELVSTEVLIRILQDSIKDNVCSGRHLILVDGLPRQLDQAMPVEKKVSMHNCWFYFQRIDL
jgi:adenylate kinase family enzyme